MDQVEVTVRLVESMNLVREADQVAAGVKVESFDPTSPYAKDYKLVAEGPHMRLWNARDTFVLEEMPGKPVKRSVRWLRKDLGAALNLTQGGGERDPQKSGAIRSAANGFIPDNILLDAKITKNMTFDQALDALKGAVQIAIDKMAVVYPSIKKWGLENWRPDTRSFLEVVPTDTTPIKVKVGSFEGTAGWSRFGFRSYAGGRGPQDHDPTYTDYDSKSPGAARKLYKLLKANPNVLSGVKDLRDFLTKNKIGFETHFSVYR